MMDCKVNMSEHNGRDHVIALLLQAKSEARRLHEPILDYLIERALDEARASALLPSQPQTPFEPIPPNVVALIRRAAARGGQDPKQSKACADRILWNIGLADDPAPMQNAPTFQSWALR
jgi:hypothetical protein